MAFVHLQVHSEFSVLKSSARLDGILEAAAAENAPAVALTDHGAMFGILEIQTRGKDMNKARKEKGLPPVKTIYGCHVYIDSPSASQKDPTSFERLTLLVENEKGYYNLLRIVSYRYEESDRWAEIPSVPLDVVNQHKEGLIAIAGDFFSRYGQNVASGRESLAREYMDSLDKIFDRDHLYLSVCDNGVQQQGRVNEFNVKLAGEMGREVVAVADVHYIKSEDAMAHKVLRCISLKCTLNDFTDARFPTDKFYFRTEEEMRELFGNIPGAIENTVKIAERCNFTVKTGIGDDFWPRFKIPKEFLESDEYTRIKEIMKAEYDAEYPVIRERELKGVIKDKKKKVQASYCADKGIAEDALTEEDKAEIERLSQPEFFDADDQKAWDKSVHRWCKPGGDADIYITHLCNERLKWRFPEEDFKFPAHETDVAKRMYKELNCIRNMNVAGYLLIVWDFINWSREHGIPVGPGRGSAAGSLVTYIIGITDIDPLKFDLLFERFLNPERVSMPDIDTDFADRDRGRVIQYVTDKYGYDCVGQIITYGMLKSKAVITDVARVLGFAPQEAKVITKLFPQRTLNFSLEQAWTGKKKGAPLEDGYSPEPLQALINSRASYQNLWDIAKKLEDLPRQTGVHACGVVITPTPIYNLAPLYRAAPADTPVVMYDKHYAEDIGLLKMDFLGLINLSIIQDTVNMVKKNRGIDLDMGHIPLDDKKTFDLLGKGMTTTVFQFESPGMQKYLRELKPTRIFDLIAMNALYRPGPIDQIPHFIARKNGKEEIDCYHPDLEQVLGETYGVIVYQEQVMKLAQILGGYTLGGADNIRRIMAKKMPEKMEKLQPEFFQKCIDKGYDMALIQKVWDAVLPFCGYAFNKSHAAAYAYVAYQTAYLKANYGPEYMAASMTSKMGKTEDIVTIIQECKRINIQVLSPNINTSYGVFTADKEGHVLYGLAGIRNVGIAVVEDVVAEREKRGPFKDIFDFCKRVAEYQGSFKEKHPPLNKKVLECLIMAGALDSFPGSRAVLMATVDRALEVAAKHQEEKSMGQMSLFDLGGASVSMENTAEVLEEAEPWSSMEMLNKEREVLGMFLSGHPLDEFRPELVGFTTSSLAYDELKKKVDSVVVVGGVVMQMRSIETKRGDTIGVGMIRDFHSDVELFFKKDTWENLRDRISEDDRILVKGLLGFKRDKERKMTEELQITVEEVVQLDTVRESMVNYIHVCMDSVVFSDDFLAKMDEGLQQFVADTEMGDHPCELVCHVETESGYEHAIVLHKYKVLYTQELLNWLRQDLGIMKLWVSPKSRR